ncbi:MAG: hypothetical protein RIC56_13210 [Pseudomonadales bacterium]
MDWDRYKALCDAPDVCSRWLLEQTLELVDDPGLAGRLRAALQTAPLAKPDDHRGGPPTDMFRLQLSSAQATALRARVERARAAGARTSATGERGLGGFVEAWREYEQFLERRAAACSARS